MTEIRDDGNEHLCGLDMHLWGMVYTVALQWQTQIMFKWDGMNCHKRRDEFIRFFVPKDSVHRYEIIEFLKGHLDKMQRDPRTYKFSDKSSGKEEESYFPGCRCEIHTTVYTFSGVHPQFPVEVSEKMCEGFVQQVMLVMGTPKRKERAIARAQERLKNDPDFAAVLLNSVGTIRLEEALVEAEKQ